MAGSAFLELGLYLLVAVERTHQLEVLSLVGQQFAARLIVA